MRGKHNGSVHSANSSGAYVRIKGTKVNPNTPSQQNVRNSFTANSKAWGNLSDAQRTQWNEYAKSVTITNVFGKVVPPTGFNYFMMLQGNLAAISQAGTQVPPGPVNIPVITGLSGSANATSEEVILTFSGLIDPNVNYQVFATAPQNPGVSFVKNQYRQITVFNDTTTSPTDISEAYGSKFGDVLRAGKRIFIRLWAIHKTTGVPGEQVECSMLIGS